MFQSTKEICLMLLLVTAWNAWADDACAQALSGSIKGVVRDDLGTPIHAAILRVRSAKTAASTIVLTDREGAYQLPRLDEGTYSVSVHKKGYESKAEKSVELVAGATERVDLVVKELRAIPVSQLSSDDIFRFIPDAPGKPEIVNTCGQCHGLAMALQVGSRTRADWEAVVTRMANIPGGYLTINDRTRGPIIDYLSTYFGPDSRLMDEIAVKAKTAQGGDRYAGEPPVGHQLVYTEYDIPTFMSIPHTAIPDGTGNVWFSEYRPGKIGRVTISSGEVKEYSMKTPDHHPHGLAIGKDRVVWFVAPPTVLGRFDPKTEQMEEIKIPQFDGDQVPSPHSVVVASNGQVWITETPRRPTPGAISSYDPKTKTFQRYMLEEGSTPYGIIEHNGIIWFTLTVPGKVGFLEPKTGKTKVFTLPTEGSKVKRLRFDSKGRLWFGEFETSKIGYFDPATEELIEYDLPFLGSPYSIFVDSHDQLWVASFHRDSFIKFDPNTLEMIEYPLPGNGILIRDMWSEGPHQLDRWWFAQSGMSKISSVEYIRKSESEN